MKKNRHFRYKEKYTLEIKRKIYTSDVKKNRHLQYLKKNTTLCPLKSIIIGYNVVFLFNG